MNKGPTLYTKTATGAVNVWRCWAEGPELVAEWGQETGALQTSRVLCKPKNVGRANATTAEEQAEKEVVAARKKQLKKKYSIDRAEALNIEARKRPMLAHDYKKHKGKLMYPVCVQRKYDGLRCFVYASPGGSVVLQSRGGDPYDVKHIAKGADKYLLSNTVLDGELYTHGIGLQELNSLVRRPQEGSERVCYVIYDIVHLHSTGVPSIDCWAARYQQLYHIAQSVGSTPHVQFAPAVWAENEAHVKALHDEFVQEGYEGAIVRDDRGPYRFGYRSPYLLKLKEFQDAEFTITGWTTGVGKFQNVPIFACVTEDGKPFDVTPRGTEAERAALLQRAQSCVGKKLTVRFFDRTTDGIPHFPVGIAVREEGS